MKFNCSYTQLEDVHKLIENPKNNNKHPDRQIEMLAKIIDYQGQRSPIVVSSRSGFVVKGHGRLQAIKKLGWSQCAIDVQDYDSEAQEYADMIADNKIAELAEFDESMMIEEIKSLEIDDFELLGFDDLNLSDDLDDILSGSDENSLQDRLKKYNEVKPKQIVLLFENEEFEHFQKDAIRVMEARGIENYKDLLISLVTSYGG